MTIFTDALLFYPPATTGAWAHAERHQGRTAADIVAFFGTASANSIVVSLEAQRVTVLSEPFVIADPRSMVTDDRFRLRTWNHLPFTFAITMDETGPLGLTVRYLSRR